MLGEFGDDPNRYAHAKACKNYAGSSPITKQSGKSRIVLARFVRNRRLAHALTWFAFCSLSASPGARAFYNRHRAAGEHPPPSPTSPTAGSASSTAAYATAAPTARPPPEPPTTRVYDCCLTTTTRGMSSLTRTLQASRGQVMAMETTRRAAVGERLPALTLEPVAGRPGDLQRTRHGTSVLLAPHLGCRECWAYIDLIGEFAARFDAWSAGVLLLGGDADDAEALAERGWAVVLPDADGRARPALGQAADVAVVVADRFGAVYRSASAGKGHELPEPGDLFEEVRYMGSLCPECGVPDDPLAGEESRGR